MARPTISPSTAILGLRICSLTERGREQAAALAGTLQGTELDAVFTSPSQRARETAGPLVSQRDLELHVVPEVAEMSFGQLGGMSLEEAAGTSRKLSSAGSKIRLR